MHARFECCWGRIETGCREGRPDRLIPTLEVFRAGEGDCSEARPHRPLGFGTRRSRRSRTVDFGYHLASFSCTSMLLEPTISARSAQPSTDTCWSGRGLLFDFPLQVGQHFPEV